uniref:HNH endonuclease n=1 Tax=Marseillevirus LCMAC101 TaxID=2506602 RepID=A0A481YS49_9VIRU|nr:MAG: HNH endonuclease [Marseillevirus LCMAC101]
MADEEWKDFPVIGGRNFSKYEVSSLGKIRNKETKWNFSVEPDSDGYIRNTYRDDEGKRINMSTHVIVARTFIGNPESDGLTVDHINRVTTDSRVVNLHWATGPQQSENSDKSSHRPKGQPID